MNSYKCNFISKMHMCDTMSSASQIYEARDLDDAIKQHDRTTTIMQATYPEYECNMVTMSKMEDKKDV